MGIVSVHTLCVCVGVGVCVCVCVCVYATICWICKLTHTPNIGHTHM